MWANGQEIFLFGNKQRVAGICYRKEEDRRQLYYYNYITTNTKIQGGFTIQNGIMDPIHG